MRAITLNGPGGSASDFELITKADLKEVIRDPGLFTTTTEDAFLDKIADGINRRAFRGMGERFIKNTTMWDQLIDGPRGSVLLLPNRPIVSITSLEYGRFDLSVWTVIQAFTADDYLPPDKEAGRLVRMPPWTWPGGPMALRAKYNAGMSVPQELKNELAKWGAVIFKRIVSDRLDKTTVSHEAEVTTYRFDEVPDECREMLAHLKYKEWAIG